MLTTIAVIEDKTLLLHIKLAGWTAGRPKSSASELARTRQVELSRELKEIHCLAHSLRGQIPATAAEALLLWPEMWHEIEQELLRLLEQDPSLTEVVVHIGGSASCGLPPRIPARICRSETLSQLAVQAGL
ncbi:hypothetical protein LJ737_00010 [Hymenobacter sp. 15J16-1T3B]|uniref:hypothetical protein n=1 Tax=Hymenobacter sp. 15J16-1T3B TaxID=2886941 RepID=UPI001D128481|nr:hypothetical protein [Hymenobacter sp. 15J16-1T3B]MCC3155600.1 hypothetical protein [Hymenobacter sp. 15J16-1T3B]